MVDSREGDEVEFLYAGIGSSDLWSSGRLDLFSPSELYQILKRNFPSNFVGRKNTVAFKTNPLKFLQKISGAIVYSINGKVLTPAEATFVDFVG